MRSLLLFALIGCVLAGCLQEPQYEYRIGQTVDVAALAHSLGDVEPTVGLIPFLLESSILDGAFTR